jgi:hypothetical protein
MAGRGSYQSTWWVIPYLSGALAVFAVAGVVSLTVGHHPAAAGRTGRPATTAPLPMPAQMVTDALFRKLTGDIQSQDEAGFLGLVAPAVRPAVRTWWQNLQAIGFTTGVIMPMGSNSVVDLNSKGNGTMTVLAGTHSALDPLDGHGNPDVPCEPYKIGLHFASATAIGQITSWQPLADAPWDLGTQLYVRKAAHVVVAGPPGDSALVDQTLPLAEAAADFDGALVDHVNDHDLHQQGFIVFVTGTASVRESWFSTSPGLARWPGEFLGGRTFPLPGASGDSTGIASGLSAGSTGGARVVITPYQDDNQTEHGETEQLTRLFMLDILAPDDEGLASGAAPPSVPEWTIEGIGVAIQTLYAQNTNPTPASYDFSKLTGALQALPASYRTGQLPTGNQLFGGSVATQENWNVVVASVYEYFEIKYGMNQMIGSAVLLYTNDTTPFGNILAASSEGTFSFYNQATIESSWRTWLASL